MDRKQLKELVEGAHEMAGSVTHYASTRSPLAAVLLYKALEDLSSREVRETLLKTK